VLGATCSLAAGASPAPPPARADESQFKSLFNGKNLAGWRARDANQPNRWTAKDGTLFNSGAGADLVTEQSFNNFEILCEVNVPPKSRGGVYLRGRHEVRLADDAGTREGFGTSGGILNLICPSMNAALPAGQWQTLDVTVTGKMVTVILNGKKVIADIMMPHPTPNALDGNVDQPGPIMLSGAVANLAFRTLRIKPLPAIVEAAAKPFAFGAKTPPEGLLQLDEIARELFDQKHPGVLPEAPLRARLPFSSERAFDWCSLNQDFFVHNQGPSSSCWANTAIEALECNWLIRNGVRLAFSPQPVLDHTQRPDGGTCAAAFDVLLRKGTATLQEYAFAGQPGKLRTSVATLYRAVAWGRVGDPNKLPTVAQVKSALLEHGPLAVDLFSTQAFRKHTGGEVFAEHYKPARGEPPHNHEVLLLGWDDSRGRGAWRIKNSWGEQWGDRGYCWIEYGCNNVCYDAWWVRAQSTYYTLPNEEFLSLIPDAVAPIEWDSPIAPIADVKEVHMEHNVVQGGKKGIVFHTAAETRRAKGKKAIFAVNVLGSDGNSVPANGKVYSSEDGHLQATTEVMPKEDDASFKDIGVFLPFEALPLREGKNDFRFRVGIFCDGKWLTLNRPFQGTFQVDHKGK
jgi:hypothetical protein